MLSRSPPATGSTPPGAPAAVTYASFQSTSPALNAAGHIAFAVINAPGQTAFVAGLAGPGVDFTDDPALFASDLDGNLSMVARLGSPMDLGNDDVRTPDFLAFYAYSGNQDGLGSGLNDLGQLGFYAQFHDGSDAVVLATIPEPAAMGLAVTPLTFVVRRRPHSASEAA